MHVLLYFVIFVLPGSVVYIMKAKVISIHYIFILGSLKTEESNPRKHTDATF